LGSVSWPWGSIEIAIVKAKNAPTSTIFHVKFERVFRSLFYDFKHIYLLINDDIIIHEQKTVVVWASSATVCAGNTTQSSNAGLRRKRAVRKQCETMLTPIIYIFHNNKLSLNHTCFSLLARVA
jgi:hypothetical protein